MCEMRESSHTWLLFLSYETVIGIFPNAHYGIFAALGELAFGVYIEYLGIKAEENEKYVPTGFSRDHEDRLKSLENLLSNQIETAKKQRDAEFLAVKRACPCCGNIIIVRPNTEPPTTCPHCNKSLPAGYFKPPTVK
jgi:hypothetical protein